MLTTPLRAALSGAGITLVSLIGGLVIGSAVGNAVFGILAGHTFVVTNPWHVVAAAIPAFAGFLGGSVLWGVWIGRMVQGGHLQSAERKRMALAGALGFAPITLFLGLLLQVLEPIAVEQLGNVFPIHRLFTFFFVPMSFLIAAVSSWAIGKGLGDDRLARKLFWQVGITSAVTFLVINLMMEALGWQVGAPGAAERATMITVLLVGDLGAAITGGALLGIRLAGARATHSISIQPAVS